MPSVTAIIPARYASTRFPGKALADINGKPLIQHVCERVVMAETVSRIAVATDDERIAEAVEAFGGYTVMTSPDHVSGTDRVAEAAAIIGGDIVLNVQGDEPLIEPATIDGVVGKILDDDDIVCSTAASPIDNENDHADPNAVKVVVDDAAHALYFSRAPIPYWRDGGFGGAYLHAGIYCFRRDFLMRFAALAPTPLEKAEKLEQLRILEHGYRIGVFIGGCRSIGVDTPEDLERARRMMS